MQEGGFNTYEEAFASVKHLISGVTSRFGEDVSWSLASLYRPMVPMNGLASINENRVGNASAPKNYRCSTGSAIDINCLGFTKRDAIYRDLTR